MQAMYKTLDRLGWPVHQMTDRQIKCELYRRWFASQPQDDEDAAEGLISVASARGIIASMANEGNLDALCWSPDDKIPATEAVPEEDRAAFLRDPNAGGSIVPDRRESPRRPERELVHWLVDGVMDDEATGWLVDRSARGIAFITQAEEAPAALASIETRIHSREDGPIPVGMGTVVRTEPLNPELTLVCVQLEEPMELM